jgi:O-antigen/teichoic acid export membrane protein
MSTRGVILKNISANLLLQIITALGGFILPPLIIITYGSATNGMLASIKQFIAYLTLLEAGIGAAAIVALYQALTSHNIILRNRILSATQRFYRTSGSLFAIGLLILSILLALLTQKQISATLTFYMVLVMGAVNIMDFFFFGSYRALLTADQKTYIISFVQAGNILVNIGVCYYLIQSGYSILIVQIASSAILISKFFLYRCYVKHTYPDLNQHIEHTEPYHLHQTWDAMTHQLTGLLIFSSPLVLITLFLSLKDASIYAVYALIFGAIKMAIQSISQGMQAIFGHSLNTDFNHTRYNFCRYNRLFMCFLGWVYTCTGLLLTPFIQLYTTNMTDANYHQPLLALLFLLIGIIENTRIPSMIMIMAAGHYKQTKPQALIEAAINLSCSVCFIQFWGITGLLIATLISFLYRSSEMLYYNCKHILSISCLRPYLLCLLIFASIAACISLGWQPVNHIKIHNYQDWIKLSCITATVAAVPFSLLLLLIYRRPAK